MTPAQRTARHRSQLVVAAARAGALTIEIEITREGVRFRDDEPIGLELSPLAELLLTGWDEPIPLVAS